jgi:DNA-binding NarL/FixJ family response regulator
METITKTSKETAAIPGQRAPVSVWLVEDDHDFRNTVAHVLNRIEDVECLQQFSNVEDALDAMAGGGVPDVILLDVELPGQNGIEAIHKIKSILPSTRIVMLTVFDNHEKIFKAICAGASGYLLKTSSLEQIIESIHEAAAGGAPMTPRVASSVLQMFSKMAQPKQGYRLTEREKTILDLMTHGLCKKEIAGQLSLSYHTVDTHLRNIYAKLHVHSCTGAVAIVLKERFL